jgi:hypothetical protein
MQGIAHGMKPRGGGGPSKEQAEEFVETDKRNKKWQRHEHAEKKAEDPTVAPEFQHLLRP